MIVEELERGRGQGGKVEEPGKREERGRGRRGEKEI